jgi:hemolysin III
MKNPLFRGLFHLLAAIFYIQLFPLFYSSTPPTPTNPLTLHLLSIILGFSCSTLFHIIHWPKQFKIYLRRLDHVMIFIKILASYYALISTISIDVNNIVIYAVVIGSIIGILLRIFSTHQNLLLTSLILLWDEQ